MELTNNGYRIKTANEWYQTILDAYLEIDPNWQTDPSSPDGLFIATTSELFATLDELLQQTYNSKDPSKAQGLELDILTYLTTGSPRKLGTASYLTMELNGLDGSVIPKGTVFQSTTDYSNWETRADVTLNGATTVEAKCQDLGAISASIGTITRIVDPIATLDSVTNTTVATLGDNPETDSELRERRQKSVAIVGSNQVENMYAAIATLDVSEVKIYENFTNSVDSNTLPPHSIGIIVNGGDPEDICKAIYSKKNAGCALAEMGTVEANHITLPVTSEITGNIVDITFNRPETIPIFVEMTIQDDGHLPSDASTLISDAIVSFAEGKTEYTAGFRKSGFRIGDDVIYSSMYTPINQVLGNYGESYITELKISRVSIAAAAASNIDIEAFELPQFDVGTMSITILPAS